MAKVKEYDHAKVGETWYRYVDVFYAPPVDEFGRHMGDGAVGIHMQKFIVDKVTPKGVQLIPDFLQHRDADDEVRKESRRFVRTDATKMYANPTPYSARESYLARKKKQKRIFEARLRKVQELIDLVSDDTCPACGGIMTQRWSGIECQTPNCNTTVCL